MEINQPIIDAVRDRLDGDPRLPRANGIAVTAHGNEVTLRGTVGSFAEVIWVTLTGDVDVQLQSDIAFDHVARLRGVTGVTNEIEVGRARRTRDRLTEMVVPDSRSFRRSRR